MSAEKDIGKVVKNALTDIIVRIDAFGGKPGLTIREFVTGSDGGYKGFTKSGTRIPADKFLEFRELINSINLEDLKNVESSGPSASASKKPAKKETEAPKEAEPGIDDY
jgi:hypothetical protein